MKDPTGIYSRKVSFTERSFFGDAPLRYQGLSIQYVFEGRGDLSLTRLRYAVQEASRANPGTRICLKGVLWALRWEATGEIPEVEEFFGEWQSDGRPNFAEKPFDVLKGPVCRVILAKAEKTFIAFRCFHGVMDGRGLLHFAEDVFRSLRSETCLGSEDARSDCEFIETKAPGQIRPYRPMIFPPPFASQENEGSKIQGVSFEITEPVVSLPAKIAAVLTQMAEFKHEKALSFMTPVDLRHYERGLRSTGNLTAPIYFRVKVGETWEIVQEHIMKALVQKEALRKEASETWVSLLPMRLVRFLIRGFEALQSLRSRYIVSVYLSHINLSKRSQYCSLDFDCESAFVTPPPTHFFPFGVSVITLEGRSRVTVFAPGDILTLSRLEELSQELKSDLKNLH